MAVQKAKTDLETELVYGIDCRTRRISFGHSLGSIEEDNGDLTQTSVELAVRAIRRMESEHPSRPIEIHMNSYGGDVTSMLYLHDIIEASTCQFKFYGGGAIQSSATWVMAVCDERYLYRNSTIMVHNGTPDSNAGKSTDDSIISTEEQKRTNYLLDELYSNNSIMPRKFWHVVCKRDLILTAHEAVQLGLADKVIEPKKRGNLRKLRSAHLKKAIENPKALKTLVNRLYKRVDIDVQVQELVLNPAPVEKNDPSIIIDPTPPPSLEDTETEGN